MYRKEQPIKREVISISFVLKQKNFSRQNCGSLYCCHRATLSTNHVTVVTLLTAIYSRYAFGTCVLSKVYRKGSDHIMTATEISFLPSCPRRERPNIVPSRSVCRQLFGPVNHEQMTEDLLREKKKLYEENTQRWNFDFENGIPLPGRYLWERLYASLSKGKTVSSFSGRVSETATSERLACCNDSAGRTTTSTTTSSDTTESISDVVASDSLESSICDPEKRSRCLRTRKSSGKITGELICLFFAWQI